MEGNAGPRTERTGLEGFRWSLQCMKNKFSTVKFSLLLNSQIYIFH